MSGRSAGGGVDASSRAAFLLRHIRTLTNLPVGLSSSLAVSCMKRCGTSAAAGVRFEPMETWTFEEHLALDVGRFGYREAI